MKTLILALLLTQNIPRHPSPATANGVPVGNGTNWVTNVVPGCFGQHQALGFDGGIVCNTIADSSVWETTCPTGFACTDYTTTSMLGWYTPAVAQRGLDVWCSATTAGTGTDNYIVGISNGSGAIANCSVPCATGRVPVHFTTGDCLGGIPLILSAGVSYRMRAVADTNCTVPPAGLVCSVILSTP